MTPDTERTQFALAVLQAGWTGSSASSGILTWELYISIRQLYIFETGAGLHQYYLNWDLSASAHAASLKRNKAESNICTLSLADVRSPYLNSSVANRKELSRNVALPEGYKPFFLEDALYGLQDAMILSPWISGGELLYLKLQENRENIFSCMSHFNKVHVSSSGIHNPNSQPMLRGDILPSHRITSRTD